MSTAVLESRPMSNNPFAPRPGLKVWMGTELVPVEQAKISVFDHGLLYGDGVFEGIRVYNGKIFKEEDHVSRFFESAKAIRLEIPMTPREVADAMHRTMEANGVTGDGYIRLVVTRGVGSLGISVHHTACPTVFVIADKIALYPPEVYERGLHCIVSSYTRNHPNSTSPRVKSLNYLNNIMAGRLLTPPTCEGILEGITRNLVIELAQKRDIQTVEKSLIRHDLYVADECFATGTAAELVPITVIDKRPVADGKPGPITKQLLEDFVAYRNSL